MRQQVTVRIQDRSLKTVPLEAPGGDETIEGSRGVKYGGDVYLRSRPGQAAQFVVSLPVASLDWAAQPELENQLRTMRQKTINY